MQGYVQNRSQSWAHAMKRSIAPGAKIPIKELYEQYGKRHNIEQGEEFVKWLRTVKLPDTNKWNIVLDGQADTKVKEEVVNEKPITVNSDRMLDPKKITVKEVVLLSVRKAREVVPLISDVKLLRYAYQEARQLADKDSLCRILKKRIAALETFSRG